MEYQEKIVEFDNYCCSCINRNVDPVDEPCDSCLSSPVNINSHKPINYIEGNADKKNIKKKNSRKNHKL